MEFRHLRCVLAVAEELPFAPATRSTRLTRAGKLFLDHVPRVFAALQQARDSVKAAANGFLRQFRIPLEEVLRYPLVRATRRHVKAIRCRWIACRAVWTWNRW